MRNASIALTESRTSELASARSAAEEVARGHRGLVARTLPVTALDAHTRDAAFALFASVYQNTSRERFEHDLAEKQYIILLFARSDGALKGFSTVLVQQRRAKGRDASIVFSGDTVIDPAYWGEKQLQLAFARLLVGLMLRAPSRPVYWFLLSKGYRTYLLLANSFPRAIPRVDRATDPALAALLHELATERYGDQYDRARGLVRYGTPQERLDERIAPLTPRALANRHVRFFLERNAGHADGIELACLARVRLIDVARAVARVAMKKVRRAATSVLSPGDRPRA